MSRIVKRKQPDGEFSPIEWKDIKAGDTLQFWEDTETQLWASENGTAVAMKDSEFNGTYWAVEISYSCIVDATLEPIIEQSN
jgi:hypothetical protein